MCSKQLSKINDSCFFYFIADLSAIRGERKTIMENLQVIKRENQRVLTTAQIAEQYGTDAKAISKNFTRNESRYVEGKHYYCLTGDTLREFKANHQIDDLRPNTNKYYLWTEKGALLHAKSLNTDKAWQAYEFLVDNYFEAKKEQPLPAMSQMEMIAAIASNAAELEKKQRELERRMDLISETISLDKGEWRRDTHSLVCRIAKATDSTIGEVYSELYILLENRAGVNLEARKYHMRKRMIQEGVPYSIASKKNNIDVIAMDKKLTEIYLAIVKEMAIKAGA